MNYFAPSPSGTYWKRVEGVTLDPLIEEMLDELDTDVFARNATTGDVQHDCLHAARCHMLQGEPNWAYVRKTLQSALSRPLT